MAAVAAAVVAPGATSIVTQSANGITAQISSFFAAGEVTHRVSFDPPIQATREGNTVYAEDFPGLRELGLEWFTVIQDDGFIYKYRFSCSNNRSCIIFVTDCEPDTYTLSMVRCGKHNLDFNSKAPKIRMITSKNY